jgi:hypothetical protein
MIVDEAACDNNRRVAGDQERLLGAFLQLLYGNSLLAVVETTLGTRMVIEAILEDGATVSLGCNGTNIRASQGRRRQLIVCASLSGPLVGMSALWQWHFVITSLAGKLSWLTALLFKQLREITERRVC